LNLTIGETVEQFQNNNNHPAPVIAYDQNDIFGEKSMEGGNYVASHHNHNNAQIGSIRWSPPFVTSITIHESDYGARLRYTSSVWYETKINRILREYAFVHSVYFKIN
jgi:hypothetical protein